MEPSQGAGGPGRRSHGCLVRPPGGAGRAAVVATTVTDAELALRVKLVDGTLLKSDLREAGNYLMDHPEDSVLAKRNINRMYKTITRRSI